MPAQARSAPKGIVIFAATCAGLLLILLLRRPEMFLNPQLWAEDGPVFFVPADRNGLRTVLTPYAGYLHVLPRLIAALAAPLPAGWVPTAYFSCCMVAFIAVAAALFSPRIDLPGKPVLALALGLVTHSGEAIGNLTNLQWVVALALVWLLLAHDAITLRQQMTDLLVAVVVGLTGVFSTILTPLFIGRAMLRRTPASITLAAGVLVTGSWQAWTVLHTAAPPAGSALLGATAGLQIIALRVGASLFLPPSLAEQLPRGILLGAGGLLVVALLATGLWPGRQRSVRFMLATASLFVSAAVLLRFRHGDFGALFSVSMGDRYFFLPKVLVLWLLIWGATQEHPARWLAVAACGAALLATGWSWRYERWQDFHWPDYARRIETGGRVKDIPLNPRGFKFDYPGHREGR